MSSELSRNLLAPYKNKFFFYFQKDKSTVYVLIYVRFATYVMHYLCDTSQGLFVWQQEFKNDLKLVILAKSATKALSVTYVRQKTLITNFTLIIITIYITVEIIPCQLRPSLSYSKIVFKILRPLLRLENGFQSFWTLKIYTDRWRCI